MLFKDLDPVSDDVLAKAFPGKSHLLEDFEHLPREFREGNSLGAGLLDRLLDGVAQSEDPVAIVDVSGLMGGFLPVVRKDKNLALVGFEQIQVVRGQHRGR